MITKEEIGFIRGVGFGALYNYKDRDEPVYAKEILEDAGIKEFWLKYLDTPEIEMINQLKKTEGLTLN